MIHLMVRRQALARDGLQLLVRFAIERQLSRERGLGIVLQRPVRRLKNVAVTICAEIRGGDRVEEKVSNEKTIAKGLEALDRGSILDLGAEPDRAAAARRSRCAAKRKAGTAR